MNEDLKEFFIIFLCVLIIASIIALCVAIPGIKSENLKAVASDKAQTLCEQKGYDVYVDFKRRIFTDEPLGVRCNYINNKYEVNGNNDDNGILVLNN